MNRKSQKKRKKRKSRPLLWTAIGTLSIWALTGCSPRQPAATQTSLPPFIPPVQSPSPEPTVQPDPGSTTSPQRSCTNQLQFIDDLSIPDGTRVERGERLVKRWLIENTGTCDWDQRYSLQLVAGNPLAAREVQPLYPARQGTRMIIQITFTAPSSSGNYSTTWQAFDPAGQRFGDPFFMDITVR